jgi:hypothetical protein
MVMEREHGAFNDAIRDLMPSTLSSSSRTPRTPDLSKIAGCGRE